MKRKTNKYRNLTKRGGTWYYQRVVDGKRYRVSLETSDKQLAAKRRDLWEESQGIGHHPPPQEEPTEAPTLLEAGKRYLEAGTDHMANTTRGSTRGYLAEHKYLMRALGDHRLDQITATTVRAWMNDKSLWVTGKDRRPVTASTKRSYLNALSQVMDQARIDDVIPQDHGPVETYRQQTRPKVGKRHRAQKVAGRDIRPIQHPQELARPPAHGGGADRLPLEAARAQGPPDHLGALREMARWGGIPRAHAPERG